MIVNKFKNITDYIYGLISIPNYYFTFIDSIYIQRLRNIRQLPTAQYVFPSVNHTCFEHSIGTYFLSNKYITDIQTRQKDLEINQTLINTISLCGLFNNLGTFPFLNSFKSFYKEKYGINYDKKQKTFDLIKKLLYSKGFDPNCMTNKNDNEDFDLDIMKKIFTKNNNKLKFYEQIVFNPKTDIDCESFDNMNRDIYKYGLPPLYDYKILMNSSQIINDEICYNYNDAFSVCNYYDRRYTLYTKFYYHRISMAIELMFVDIFKYIGQIYNFYDIINDNDKFIYFFDSFIYNIKHNNKDNKNIKEAKKLLDNIDKRNLYAYIGEYYLSDNENKIDFDNFDAKTLINNKNKKDIELDPNEIRIKKDVIYLGTGDNDPLNNITFYDNEYKIVKRKIEDVSKLLPNRFKSRIIRIFLTNKDKKKIEAAQNALNNYKQKYSGNIILYKSEQKINKKGEEKISNFNIGIGMDIDEKIEENKDGLKEKENNKNNLKRTINKKKEKGYSQFFKEMNNKKK